MDWIGVDLDGTLAEYPSGEGLGIIGKPIPKMVGRVKAWLLAGREVRIFTARATVPEQIPLVEGWCLKHLGVVLRVTSQKDFEMSVLWDDRCVQVKPNTGEVVGS